MTALMPLPNPPRQVRRRADAKLNRSQVRAAWTIYRSGRSIEWLAERLWRRYGFANQAACASTLSDAFARGGLPTRPRNYIGHPRHAKNCAGCGCAMDERTYGCASCASRHYWRRQRGHTPVITPPRFVYGRCVGCSVPWDERTVGCDQCGDRHRRRARAAA